MTVRLQTSVSALLFLSSYSMNKIEKVWILLLFQSLCIAQTQGFNVGTSDAKIFISASGVEFGYNVQQFSNSRGKWLLVGSPWSGYPNNRTGDIYKCNINGASCQKLNLENSVNITGVENININMSLGLTLTSMTKSKGNAFMTCGPLWAQRCGSQYFYPGICVEVNSKFSPQRAFVPAIQTCGGPMDVAIVLDGSNSIHPWEDVVKFLINLLNNLKIGPDQTRVSIMQYSVNVTSYYNFSSNQIKQNVLSTAKDLEQKTGTSTFTFNAIDIVRKEAFLPENGGRPGATKVMVVVTDGKSFDGHIAQEVIDKCNKDGIIRFGIAILKKDADLPKFIQEIELIASTPTENYMFNVSSEEALNNIAGTLGDRIFNIEGTSQGESFKMEMSQVGFSAHQTNNKNGIMLGAVGAYGWSGTVVHQNGQESQIFAENGFEKILDDRNHSSLLGYSVSTLIDGSSEFYVAGAPRAVHKGQVVVYTIREKQPFIVDSQRGDQIGSYFGSVLCPVDVDADGVTDVLLVGAPMYMSEKKFETGRVYLFSINKGTLGKQGTLEGSSALENARFGTAITSVRDLNLDGFSDVVVGAPLEGNGQGAIYIYFGDRKTIRRQSSQKILGSKLDQTLRLFGRSLDSREDMNGDSIPDISVGGFEKAVQLWSKGVASVTTMASFNPDKINILKKPCQIGGGRWVSCFTAKVCFTSTFRPKTLAGPVDIKYNLTLDADLESSRAISRAQFENSERGIQRAVSVSNTETCIDHKVNVQETPDFVNAIALRLDISPQNPDIGPALDAFHPKAWEYFIPFVKDCGSDEKCTCDLKLTVKAVNVPSSSSMLVNSERRRLSFSVTVMNRKENAYNTRISANFSSNLFYASFTPPTDNTEVKCTSKANSLDCQVGYPALTTGQTVSFEISFDFNLNQLQKNAIADFEVQSDSEEEVTSDNKVSIITPIQYDSEILLTRYMNLDFCLVGAEDQVKNTVSDFDDIGPEFNLVLQVSTGNFPINQAELTVSLPTSTNAGNPLLYVTSVKTAPVGNVQCYDSILVDPLKISEKAHTASFTKESFRGTKELNCQAVKCEPINCRLKDLEIKSNYFVNITVRLWNGTFAFADFQTVSLAGDAVIKTSQPDLIVITHNKQQIRITVSKEGASGDIPIGIIIGSVIGGLLLLALVTVILWKLGFFKRKKLPEKTEQDQAEEEGLCDNTP